MTPASAKVEFVPLRPASFLPLFFLLACFMVAGCLTTSDKTLFTVSGSGWTVQQGQAIWKPAGDHPQLAGEIVLARNSDGRSSLQFTKTLLPVVLAQTTSARWLIQFPPQRLGFQGRGLPPQRFVWLYLSAALDGKTLPQAFQFTRHPDGGWRLENRRTGEFVEGFLSP